MANPLTARPGMPLSRKEEEMLRLVALGKTSKEIGIKLGCAEQTVKSYIESVLIKLTATSRANAVYIYMRDRMAF
jgi:DNA-binding CsgD family transcriptional regulator